MYLVCTARGVHRGIFDSRGFPHVWVGAVREHSKLLDLIEQTVKMEESFSVHKMKHLITEISFCDDVTEIPSPLKDEVEAQYDSVKETRRLVTDQLLRTITAHHELGLLFKSDQIDFARELGSLQKIVEDDQRTHDDVMHSSSGTSVYHCWAMHMQYYMNILTGFDFFDIQNNFWKQVGSVRQELPLSSKVKIAKHISMSDVDVRQKGSR